MDWSLLAPASRAISFRQIDHHGDYVQFNLTYEDFLWYNLVDYSIIITGRTLCFTIIYYEKKM